MNTTRSDAQVEAYRDRNARMRRRTLVFERDIPHEAGDIFVQLCPSRECDWIPGWTSDLVFTETGYIEQDCIFRTDDANGFGAGVWVCCRYEPDRRVEFVRFMGSLVFQLRISLTPSSDGHTHVEWRIVLTALDDDGNRRLEDLPDLEARFEGAIDALIHFLDTGEMVSV